MKRSEFHSRLVEFDTVWPQLTESEREKADKIAEYYEFTINLAVTANAGNEVIYDLLDAYYVELSKLKLKGD